MHLFDLVDTAGIVIVLILGLLVGVTILQLFSCVRLAVGTGTSLAVAFALTCQTVALCYWLFNAAVTATSNSDGDGNSPNTASATAASVVGNLTIHALASLGIVHSASAVFPPTAMDDLDDIFGSASSTQLDDNNNNSNNSAPATGASCLMLLGPGFDFAATAKVWAVLRAFNATVAFATHRGVGATATMATSADTSSLLAAHAEQEALTAAGGANSAFRSAAASLAVAEAFVHPVDVVQQQELELSAFDAIVVIGEPTAAQTEWLQQGMQEAVAAVAAAAAAAGTLPALPITSTPVMASFGPPVFLNAGFSLASSTTLASAQTTTSLAADGASAKCSDTVNSCCVALPNPAARAWSDAAGTFRRATDGLARRVRWATDCLGVVAHTAVAEASGSSVGDDGAGVGLDPHATSRPTTAWWHRAWHATANASKGVVGCLSSSHGTGTANDDDDDDDDDGSATTIGGDASSRNAEGWMTPPARCWTTDHAGNLAPTTTTAGGGGVLVDGILNLFAAFANPDYHSIFAASAGSPTTGGGGGDDDGERGVVADFAAFCDGGCWAESLLLRSVDGGDNDDGDGGSHGLGLGGGDSNRGLSARCAAAFTNKGVNATRAAVMHAFAGRCRPTTSVLTTVAVSYTHLTLPTIYSV